MSELDELPFNLNYIVRFKMTPSGLKLWDKYHTDLGINAPPVPSEMAMQLWEMMHIFGPGMVIGFDPPIETEIILMMPTNAKSPPLGGDQQARHG